MGSPSRWVVFSALGFASLAFSQEPAGGVVAPGADIAALSLDDLLAQPIEVASHRAESAREAAGVVTVLTREEIVASGARDLSDLLWLVPGFTQNLDVENVTGLSVRGVWSYEGKVLLLVDGVDMTDLLYGVNPLGLHYLTSNIERLEIIRGPGSAIHGGNAGMAVISIITRGAKEVHGAEVEARYGQLSGTSSDRTIGLNLGHTFDVPGQLAVSVSGYLGQGNRSDGTYTSSAGDAWALSNGGAATNPMLLNVGVTWRGLKARLVVDNYTLTTIDGLGELATATRDGATVPAPATMSFRATAGDVRYTFQLGDAVTLEPRLYASLQRPWFTPDPTSSLYYDKHALRSGASVTATWAALPGLHLLAGVDAHRDDAWLSQPALAGFGANPDFAALNPTDPSRATLSSLSAFGQLQADTPVANFTLGGRAETHSVAGESLVPRLAATRRFDRFTAKLLFSGAYRAPSFENFNSAPGGVLKPEELWVGEAELGFQATDWAFVSANVYGLRVDDPILYTVNPGTGAEGYVNAGHVGSRGVEAEARLQGALGFLRLGYSFAQASPDTDVSAYLLADTKARLRGMPGHKLNLLGHLALPKGYGLNATAWLVSDRTALGSSLADEVFPTALIINANARWDAAETSPVRGLAVTLGVNNVFDQPLPWLQPYDGGHPPIPGRGRDIFFRLGYALPL